MADQKLSNTIRNASAVDLRYSADLLNLGRDYVKAFAAALTQPDEARADDSASQEPARPPLLLAGRAGETANAAFALNASSKMDGTITLQINGDFGDSKVSVDPDTLSLEDGGEKIVRIIAKVGRKTPADTDLVGEVVIPELNHRVTGFVLRRLP